MLARKLTEPKRGYTGYMHMVHLCEIRRRVKIIPGVRDMFVSIATRIMKVEPVFKL